MYIETPNTGILQYIECINFLMPWKSTGDFKSNDLFVFDGLFQDVDAMCNDKKLFRFSKVTSLPERTKQKPNIRVCQLKKNKVYWYIFSLGKGI